MHETDRDTYEIPNVCPLCQESLGKVQVRVTRRLTQTGGQPHAWVEGSVGREHDCPKIDSEVGHG